MLRQVSLWKPSDDAHVFDMARIDLHRHLSGSVRLSTLRELATTHGLPASTLPARDFRESVRLHRPVKSLRAFVSPQSQLRPWHILHRVMTSSEIVARVTYEALEDAAQDGLDHIELRVSPYGLVDSRPLPFSEFLCGMRMGIAKARADFTLSCSVSLSLIRHELVRLSASARQQYYNLLFHSVEEYGADLIGGFDLAGTERSAPPALFAPFFQEAKLRGFGITIHAGEGEPASNIRDAVMLLQADRIGHGATLVDSDDVIKLVRSRGVFIEVCLTANVMTSVIPSLLDHPLPRLLQQGVRAVLCTDNPTILGASLADEYIQAYNVLGLHKDTLALMSNHAKAAMFVPALSRLSASTRRCSSHADLNV